MGNFDPFIGHEKLFYDNFQKFLSCPKNIDAQKFKIGKKQDRNELLEKSKITVIFQDSEIFNVWKVFFKYLLKIEILSNLYG